MFTRREKSIDIS